MRKPASQGRKLANKKPYTDVSDRRLQVKLTQKAKIATGFSFIRAIFAFAGFVNALRHGSQPCLFPSQIRNCQNERRKPDFNHQGAARPFGSPSAAPLVRGIRFAQVVSPTPSPSSRRPSGKFCTRVSKAVLDVLPTEAPVAPARLSENLLAASLVHTAGGLAADVMPVDCRRTMPYSALFAIPALMRKFHCSIAPVRLFDTLKQSPDTPPFPVVPGKLPQGCLAPYLVRAVMGLPPTPCRLIAVGRAAILFCLPSLRWR